MDERGVLACDAKRCAAPVRLPSLPPLPRTGALAGVMWVKILEVKGLRVSYLQFMRYGLCIMTPTAMMALLTLYAVLA